MTAKGGGTVRVADLMTRSVQTAAPGMEVQEIWRILVRERCHHIPVVLSRKPIGIISTSDLVRVARQHGATKLTDGHYGEETAASTMSTDLQTIGSDEPVENAIDRIGEGSIHSLLVVDDDGFLVGIVTNHDLLHYLTT